MDTRTAKTDIRRIVLAVTITSFSVAALMGISALLGAGELGETSVRVLLTTVAVGSGSVLTLCCLVVLGGRFGWAGAIGFLVVLMTTGFALVLIWSVSDDVAEGVIETFVVAVVASVTLAQVCLLLGLAAARRSLAWMLWSTVGLALVLAVWVSSLIYREDADDSQLRVLGVIAILDVLGTLVTIAIGVFGRDDRSLTITLPPSVASRIRAESAESGRPVGDLVGEALTRYYGLQVD